MNVGRIAEMMMFYEIAGGSSYTGLSHNYQGRTDLSDLLTSQRAILVGELKGSSLSARSDLRPIRIQAIQNTTK